MKRILILANDESTIYNFRRELVKKLSESKYEVIISYPNKTKKTDEILMSGCKYAEIKLERKGKNPFNDLKLIFNYKNMIKKIKPDIVLTYTVKPNIYGGIASFICKVPYISNVTGMGIISKKSVLQKLLFFMLRISLKRAACVFFQNESNRSFFIKNNICNNNTDLLPGSGVNLDLHKFEEFPEYDGKIKFITVSRLQKDKGYDELFTAIKELKKDKNIEFHIVGWSEDDEYEKKLKELLESDSLIYHGSVSQDKVHELVKQAHCLIHPSYHEGLSNVCLETAAAGRPILASNIPGCIEIVEENINGLLFEPQNSDSLIESIRCFLELPYEMKKQMGIYGRQKVEKYFDRNIVIEKYLSEINRIIKE